MEHFEHRIVRIGDLVPYASNARTHSAEQVAQLAGSIRAFGFTNPVLIDENRNVIAGHGRIEAARKLGISEVPVIVVTGLDEQKRRALILADNKLALNAGWDEEVLANELRGLGDLVELTGFSEEELLALTEVQSDGNTDPDDVPDEPVEPITQPGDTWILGRHRLRCGDSTSADDVAALLGDVRPHLMVTDPPYGLEYDAEWRSSLDQYNQATGLVKNDDREDWSEAYALFPGHVAYVWHVGFHADEVKAGLESCGFTLRAQIIWVKPHFTIGRGHYHVQHEPCWYAVKGKGEWQGSRKESTVWQIANALFQGGKQGPENAKTGHSTQKPVECMKRPIENNSSPGQAVYEPFSGSGTTIIAAEMTGRHCYAMELHPPYVDVAVKRWQNFTGEQAVLEATGEPFPEAPVAEAA